LKIARGGINSGWVPRWSRGGRAGGRAGKRRGIQGDNGGLGLREVGFSDFDGTKPISRNRVWIVGVAGSQGMAPRHFEGLDVIDEEARAGIRRRCGARGIRRPVRRDPRRFRRT